MREIEMYIYENELWAITDDGRNHRVSENEKETIQPILATIREQYPEAYAALEECYSKSASNVPYYQYLIVRRFCKCNCGTLDPTEKDIDHHGRFHFENVSCPLRGECRYEGRICKPKFNSSLSEAELRVMKLIYEGLGTDEVADRLYLSPYTVKNHIKSVYQKLNIHEKAEFISYAHNHNLFKD